MTRVVLDTNVLVSALTGGRVTGRIYSKIREGEFEPLFSPDLIEELAFVLARPAFGLAPTEIEAVLAFLLTHGAVVVPSEKIIDCRDPEDNKALECAVEGRADCLVTGDKDLLVLHPFRGIPILKPREFLTELAARSSKTRH